MDGFNTPCRKLSELGWHSIFICIGNILPTAPFSKSVLILFLKRWLFIWSKIRLSMQREVRKLEFSSSPEIFDNSLQAWFQTMTNYDLSLMHFLFQATSELAAELNLKEESAHWDAMKETVARPECGQRGEPDFCRRLPLSCFASSFFSCDGYPSVGID